MLFLPADANALDVVGRFPSCEFFGIALVAILHDRVELPANEYSLSNRRAQPSKRALLLLQAAGFTCLGRLERIHSLAHLIEKIVIESQRNELVFDWVGSLDDCANFGGKCFVACSVRHTETVH